MAISHDHKVFVKDHKVFVKENNCYQAIANEGGQSSTTSKHENRDILQVDADNTIVALDTNME